MLEYNVLFAIVTDGFDFTESARAIIALTAIGINIVMLEEIVEAFSFSGRKSGEFALSGGSCVAGIDDTFLSASHTLKRELTSAEVAVGLADKALERATATGTLGGPAFVGDAEHHSYLNCKSII